MTMLPYGCIIPYMAALSLTKQVPSSAYAFIGEHGKYAELCSFTVEVPGT